MNNIFKYGFFALIVAIILIITFQGQSEGDKLYLDQLHAEIEGLNENISRLEAENSIIVTDLALKMDSISVLSSDLQEIEKKRIAAIRYYEKRIKSRDNLAVHDLDSLFADRFGGRAPQVDGR